MVQGRLGNQMSPENARSHLTTSKGQKIQNPANMKNGSVSQQLCLKLKIIFLEPKSR